MTTRHIIVDFVAEVDKGHVAALGEELERLSGIVNSPNCPFGMIPAIHFASFTVFPSRNSGATLVFECNAFGSFDNLLDTLTTGLPSVLSSLFQHSNAALGNNTSPADLRKYLRSIAKLPSAQHIGTVGTSVSDIVTEAQLVEDSAAEIDRWQRIGTRFKNHALFHAALSARFAKLNPKPPRSDGITAKAARSEATKAVVLRLIGVSVLALLLVALAIVQTNSVVIAATLGAIVVVVVLLIAVLRIHEWLEAPKVRVDLESERAASKRLAPEEDRFPVNHLVSMTTIHSSIFRRGLLRLVLYVSQFSAARSTNGKLSGIPTIHFAHWVILDGGRLLFCSNYSGSWSSYLDDFVDKANLGLTAIWSNTVGFPRTKFLVLEGAADGVAFKAFAKSSQTPSAVWYVAPPYRQSGNSVGRILINRKLHEGLQASRFSDTDELEDWCRKW